MYGEFSDVSSISRFGLLDFVCRLFWRLAILLGDADPARVVLCSQFGCLSRRNTIDEAKEGELGNCKADDCKTISINGSPPVW